MSNNYPFNKDQKKKKNNYCSLNLSSRNSEILATNVTAIKVKKLNQKHKK